ELVQPGHPGVRGRAVGDAEADRVVAGDPLRHLGVLAQRQADVAETRCAARHSAHGAVLVGELDLHPEPENPFVPGGADLQAGDLIMAAIESVGADQDMREFNDRSSAAMTANMLTLTKAWKRNGLLREGLDAKSAAAMLYTLSSPHVYHLMRRRQGWRTKRYR